MNKITTKKPLPGRPTKNENDKKVQVIFYIPRKNVENFKQKVEPIKKRFSKI